MALTDAFLLQLVQQYRLYPGSNKRTAVARLRHAIFIRKVDFRSDNRSGVIYLQIGLNYPATSSDKTVPEHIATNVFWSIFRVDSAYMNRAYPLPSNCRHADCDDGGILLVNSAAPGKLHYW